MKNKTTRGAKTTAPQTEESEIGKGVWSITDKFERWEEYAWAFAISAIVYVFVYKSDLFTPLWVLFLFAIPATYLFTVGLKATVKEMPPKFNYLFAIGFYIFAVIATPFINKLLMYI